MIENILLSLRWDMMYVNLNSLLKKTHVCQCVKTGKKDFHIISAYPTEWKHLTCFLFSFTNNLNVMNLIQYCSPFLKCLCSIRILFDLLPILLFLHVTSCRAPSCPIYIQWSYILYVAGIICLFWFTSAFTFVRTVLKHSYTLVNPVL